MPPKMQWKTNPELIDLTNFLIERCKDAQSPQSIPQLIAEFKEKIGSSQVYKCLEARIRKFRFEIHRLDSIDTERKVRMMFALGTSIDEELLNELRKDADVEVNKENRITKYISKNGSLNLEGEHSHSAKMKEGWKQRKSRSEKRQKDSGDGSMKPSPKTPGSVKRSAVEVPTPSKRARDSSPTPVMNFDDYAPNDSARAPRTHQHRQPKQEEVTPGPSEARQEAPILRAGSPGAHSPQETPIKPELDQDEDDVSYTPQIIFLEAIHFVVINLDLDKPSLSMLKAKIEKNLRESPNALIPNEEIILAMTVLVTKMTNHSVSNLPEHVKSVGLSDFLCYLKAAILNSKLEGLEDLLAKIQRRINNPSLKLKNIPVEKVASDLRTTINVIKL